MRFSERLNLKDDALPTILDLMSHHTSVSNVNWFYYVATIASSIITDRLLDLICINAFLT